MLIPFRSDLDALGTGSMVAVRIDIVTACRKDRIDKLTARGAIAMSIADKMRARRFTDTSGSAGLLSV